MAEKDEFELQLAEFAEEIKTLEKAEQEAVTVEEVDEVEEVEEVEGIEGIEEVEEIEEIEEVEEIEEIEEIEEVDDELPWFEDDETVESEEDLDIVIATVDEREEELDEEDPWLAHRTVKPVEIVEEIEEETEEIPEIVEEIEEEIEEIPEIVEEIEEEIEEIPEVPVGVESIIGDIEEISGIIEKIEDPDAFVEEVDEESLEEELTEVEEAEEGGFDETDLEFLQKMGYSAAFGGEEVVKQTEVQDTYVKEPFGDVAFDNGGEEYVSSSQREKIKAEYAMEKRNAIIRLCIAGGAALLLFIYEMLCFSGVSLPWMFNQQLYPLSHAMVSLQLLVIAAAMSTRMLAKGISDLFCLRVTPYSVGSVSVILNVVYTIVIAIVRPDNFALYNFTAAFAVLVGLVYEYVMAVNEEKTFATVSADGKERFALVDDEADGSPVGDEPALRAFKTDFNKNFFSQMGKRSAEHKYLSVLILAVFSAAVVALAVLWIVTGNGSEAAKAAMLIVNFSLPLGTMGAFCLPMLGALRSLEGVGAVIGHGAADKYEKTRFVTFDETDLFPSMKTTHVDLKPAGNRHISDVLRKTGILFSAIGGPLRGMVEIEEVPEGSAEITGIFDNGISAVVESLPMLAGDATFMQINGVDINAPIDHRDADSQSEILYIAIEGRLAARYYIKYIPDEDFIGAVNMLGDSGISVGIRTRNPGVNARIIEKRCPSLKYKVYTIKAVSDDERDLVSHKTATVSGLVASGKASNLSYPLAAAMKMKKYYKVDAYLRMASAAVGAIFVLVFAILGRLADIGSLYAAIYQLVWFVPAAFMLLMFKKKKN